LVRPVDNPQADEKIISCTFIPNDLRLFTHGFAFLLLGVFPDENCPMQRCVGQFKKNDAKEIGGRYHYFTSSASAENHPLTG
jgi:hypothetical protein